MVGLQQALTKELGKRTAARRCSGTAKGRRWGEVVVNGNMCRKNKPVKILPVRPLDAFAPKRDPEVEATSEFSRRQARFRRAELLTPEEERAFRATWGTKVLSGR
jgi:hypothetical protein